MHSLIFSALSPFCWQGDPPKGKEKGNKVKEWKNLSPEMFFCFSTKQGSLLCEYFKMKIWMGYIKIQEIRVLPYLIFPWKKCGGSERIGEFDTNFQIKNMGMPTFHYFLVVRNTKGKISKTATCKEQQSWFLCEVCFPAKTFKEKEKKKERERAREQILSVTCFGPCYPTASWFLTPEICI